MKLSSDKFFTLFAKKSVAASADGIKSFHAELGQQATLSHFEPSSFLSFLESEKVSRAEAEYFSRELLDCMSKVPATPNPMNPKTNILRRQAAFGKTSYSFSGQDHKCTSALEDAPRILSLCVQFAVQAVCTYHLIPVNDGEKDDEYKSRVQSYYTGVFVNLYPTGRAGVQMHQDNEQDGETKGYPIVSFTLYPNSTGQQGEQVRTFVVSTASGKKNRPMPPKTTAYFPAANWSVIIMHGKRFQTDLWHGVNKTCKKEWKDKMRINITVRPWGETSEVGK